MKINKRYFFAASKKMTKPLFEQYVVRKISDEKESEFEKIQAKGERLKKEKTVSPWLFNISYVVALFGLALIFGILQADDGFENAMKSRGWLFYLGIILLLIGIITWIFCYFTNKKANKDPQVLNYISETNSIIEEAHNELNIPLSSIKIDVIFALTKKDKNNHEKFDNMGLIRFINQELHIFIEDGKLCFGDHSMVIGIPIESIINIEEVKKNICLPKWNKEKKPNSEEYKKYKIRQNGYGLFYSKPYFCISLCIDGVESYFYLPNYDIDSFRNLISNV